MHKKGLVLGKFMPPHKGHEFLFRFASQCCEELIIVVDNAQSHTIDPYLRQQWVQELMPNAKVLVLPKFMPQDPSECIDFWDIWRTELLRLTGPVDVLIASENYGHRLSAELSCEFIQLDVERENINICATDIRKSPFKYWDYIVEPARHFFTKKICFIGPESTGKSTICKKLAKEFHTFTAQEYAKSFINQKKSNLALKDMLTIAQRQQYAENALSRMANKIIFCDSDAITTAVWSEALFKEVDPGLNDLAQKSFYDLTFLMFPDTPWVWDAHRDFENTSNDTFRLKMFEDMEKKLIATNRNYVVLKGTFEEKENNARQAVYELIKLYS